MSTHYREAVLLLTYLEVNTNTTPASHLGGVVLCEEQPATEDHRNRLKLAEYLEMSGQ